MKMLKWLFMVSMWILLALKEVVRRTFRNRFAMACVLLFLAPVFLMFGQDAVPAEVIPVAPVAGNWFLGHWQGVVNAVIAVIVLARTIVVLTPTPADDSFLEKIVGY